MRERDTKAHQQRRIGLDVKTCVVLLEHLHRQNDFAEAASIVITSGAFLFSLDPD